MEFAFYNNRSIFKLRDVLGCLVKVDVGLVAGQPILSAVPQLNVLYFVQLLRFVHHEACRRQ